MTKDEMATLLRSVGCDENTITAMENAYELGFEQGAAMSDHAQDLVFEAVGIANSVDKGVQGVYTGDFWDVYNKIKGMV